jgi:hypothetical protein
VSWELLAELEAMIAQPHTTFTLIDRQDVNNEQSTFFDSDIKQI